MKRLSISIIGFSQLIFQLPLLTKEKNGLRLQLFELRCAWVKTRKGKGFISTYTETKWSQTVRLCVLRRLYDLIKMSKALTQRKLEFLICMLLTWKTGHSISIADQRESRNKNILLLEHIRTKLVGDYTRFKVILLCSFKADVLSI